MAKSKSKSHLTIGPVVIVIVAALIGYWYLKKHTDIFGGATLSEAISTGATQKKKEEETKIASLGGGARKPDYTKVKFY